MENGRNKQNKDLFKLSATLLSQKFDSLRSSLQLNDDSKNMKLLCGSQYMRNEICKAFNETKELTKLELTNENLEAIAVIRRSLLCLNLYNILWDHSNREKCLNYRNETINCLSYTGCVKLLFWAINADMDIKIDDIYQECIDNIVDTERKILSLSVENNNRSENLNIDDIRMSITINLTKLFFLGAWDYVVIILSHCFNDNDEAIIIFLSTLKKIFPSSIYEYRLDLGVNHPLYHLDKIFRFRESLQHQLTVSNCYICKHHILRIIVEIFVYRRNFDDFDQVENSLNCNCYQISTQKMSESSIEKIKSSEDSSRLDFDTLKNKNFDNHMNLNFRTEKIESKNFITGLFKTTYLKYVINIIWFRNEIIGNYIEKTSFYDNGIHESYDELPIVSNNIDNNFLSLDDLTYHLIFKNDLSTLISCITDHYTSYNPFFPALMTIFVMNEYTVSLEILVIQIIYASIDIAEFYSDNDWNEKDEMNLEKWIEPCRYALNSILDSLNESEEFSLDKIFELCKSIKFNICSYTIISQILDILKIKLNSNLFDIKIHILLRIIERNDPFCLNYIYSVFELVELVNCLLKQLVESISESNTVQLDSEIIKVNEILYIIDSWLSGLNSSGKITVVTCIQKNFDLIKRFFSNQQPILLIKRCNELILLALYEKIKKNNSNKDMITLIWHSFLVVANTVLHKNINIEKLWELIHSVEDQVVLPKIICEQLIFNHKMILNYLPEGYELKMKKIKTFIKLSSNSDDSVPSDISTYSFWKVALIKD